MARGRLEHYFAVFATAYSYIDQACYLDAAGQEVVRIDHVIRIVPAGQLQDKSDRYYFRDALPCLERNGADLRFALAEVEKRHIHRVMRHCKSNKTKAAGLLGITRLTLRHKIKPYGCAEFLDVPE